MAWEERGGNLYYYRSVREGGRTRKEYVGGRTVGELAAEADGIARERREKDAAQQRRERERAEELAAPVAGLSEAAEILARAHLIAAGCHRHKGEWRRARA